MFGLSLCVLAVGSSELSAQPRKKQPVTGSATPTGGTSNKADDAVVLEVGRERFSIRQIADAYKKNGNRGGKTFYQLDQDSAADFLNMYANYRLKVQAAYDAGLDKLPELTEELRSNRQQLAIPPAPATGYLIERKVIDPAIEDIFKRRKEEIRVGLIFVSMRANDPVDTMRAFGRANRLLQQLQQGANFNRLAIDSSDDPGTKQTGGMAYITSGMFFPPLEEAAYEMKAGEVYPAVVRVPGGYVILKNDRRAPRVKVRPAHILIESSSPDVDNDATRAAKAEAVEIYRRIKGGEDFAKVAMEVSDDKESGKSGGDLLGFYTRSLGFEAKNGKLVPEFEEALFNLKDGEISEPVHTQFGYHIIKRLESRTPTFEEEKETIRQMFKNYFLNDARVAYVGEVLRKQGLRVNEAALAQVLTSVNQSATSADSNWASRISPELRRNTLYGFGGATYTVGSWIDSVNSRPSLSAMPLTQEGIRRSIQALLETQALTQEAATLEKEYPEFASLMEEFRDGLMIFRLTDETIWSKLNDTTRARAFFLRNSNRYMTQPVVGLSEIFLYKEDEVKQIHAAVAANPSGFDEIAAQQTQRPGFREKKGRYEPATAKNADLVRQVLALGIKLDEGQVLAPIKNGQGWSIIRINSIAMPRTMTYEEARMEGAFIDDFQKELEREWLSGLRLKYKVKIDDRALKTALAARG